MKAVQRSPCATDSTDIGDVVQWCLPGLLQPGDLRPFNNRCSTDDEYADCEFDLILGSDGGGVGAGGGNFIIVDQAVNPGYQAAVASPDNDNDIRLGSPAGGDPGERLGGAAAPVIRTATTLAAHARGLGKS